MTWLLQPATVLRVEPIEFNRAGRAGHLPTCDDTLTWRDDHAEQFVALALNLLVVGADGRVRSLELHDTPEAAAEAFASIVKTVTTSDHWQVTSHHAAVEAPS